jgi:predicted anti-sigma-YlaC factor YlaD
MAAASIRRRVTSDHLPALYRGFSDRAARAQREYLRSQRWLLWLLIVAAVVSAVGHLAPVIVGNQHVPEVERDLAAGVGSRNSGV